MKTKYYVLLLGSLLVLASCDIDNYDEPESFLQGQIMYNGDPINVGYNELGFELWQPGFGKLAPIDVPVAQDGTYSSRLFDGNYKLVFRDNQGPFKTNIVNAQQKDTIFVALSGDQTLNIEVTPYYMIRNAQFAKSGDNITATCSVEQIITGADARDIERVTLYINVTQFVSDFGEANKARADGDFTDPNNISLSVGMLDFFPNATRDYVFARIGVKIAGVEDMIYSPVEKVAL